jgi:2-polyprenyl-3-methyl-5-hydroxy-6-metoxy-1,4-benzoquinol methylase
LGSEDRGGGFRIVRKALEIERDAFGHALLDQFEGRPAQELIERSDGYVDVSAGAETYLSEPSNEQRLVADRAVGRVLDIGCGAGRFALYLERMGRDVVGIDVSPLAIEVCRRRGLKDARVMSVEEVDTSLGKFDTVLMLGNNLALLGSARGAKRILKRLSAVVVPGGSIIGDTLDPYMSQDPNHLAYHADNRSKGRMGGQIRMRVRYKQYKSPWFDYLFLSREELEGLLEGSAWRLKEIIAESGPGYAVRLERV